MPPKGSLGGRGRGRGKGKTAKVTSKTRGRGKGKTPKPTSPARGKCQGKASQPSAPKRPESQKNALKASTSARTKAIGKRPVIEQNVQARKKATYDTHMLNSVEQGKRFAKIFATRKVMHGRNINFLDLRSFRFDHLFGEIGWLPIVSLYKVCYPRLVRCFCSNMRCEDEGLITTNVNGVEIKFDVEQLCAILDIKNEGICLYESKQWLKVQGFEPAKAVEMMTRISFMRLRCRPPVHALTVLSRILQHMIGYIILPNGGHRDDVSFFEVFLVDSILTGRKVNVGYIIFQHMKLCSKSTTSVLPYRTFITKIMKYFNVNLCHETHIRKLTSNFLH